MNSIYAQKIQNITQIDDDDPKSIFKFYQTKNISSN